MPWEFTPGGSWSMSTILPSRYRSVNLTTRMPGSTSEPGRTSAALDRAWFGPLAGMRGVRVRMHGQLRHGVLGPGRVLAQHPGRGILGRAFGGELGEYPVVEERDRGLGAQAAV